MTAMKKTLLNPAGMLIAGLCLGAVSRLLDMFTQNLGNILSQLSIWILLGVLIAIYSPTPRKAMGNILPFCLGMLATYYLAAVLTKGVYSRVFIIGWTGFALLSPILAYVTWWTKQPGALARLLAVGIVLFSVASTILLFDRLRVYDLAINGGLIYFLFFKQVKRESA